MRSEQNLLRWTETTPEGNAVGLWPTGFSAGSGRQEAAPDGGFFKRLQVAATAAFIDFLSVVAASMLASVAYHDMVYGDAGALDQHLHTGTILGVAYVYFLQAREGYAVADLLSASASVSKIAFAWNLAFVAFFVISFLTKSTDVFSRGSLLLLYPIGFVFALFAGYGRGALFEQAAQAGWIARPTAIVVGTYARIRAFVQEENVERIGRNIVGALIVPEKFVESSTKPLLEEAVDLVRSRGVEDVFLLLPWVDPNYIQRARDAFALTPTSLHLCEDYPLFQCDGEKISHVGSKRSVRLRRPPLSHVQSLIKRVFDVTASVVLLVVLSPVLLATTLLLKLEGDGTVFFRQRRHGFNNNVFWIYKFRTMSVAEDGDVVAQAVENDPRITKIGRWLRATNVDELPQLVNVIKGDMSLVGPRPHAVAHNVEHSRKLAEYARRHNIRPGITGWAQVKGFRGGIRTISDLDERLRHDLYYIDNWSLAFDLVIIARTLLSRTAYANAY